MGRTFNTNAQNPVWSIKRTAATAGYRLMYVGGVGAADQERDPADVRVEWGYVAARPFATIQYALDHVPNIDDDVYILITAGTYAESLNVSSKQAGRIFLIGQPVATGQTGTIDANEDVASEASGLHRWQDVGGFGGVTAGNFLQVLVDRGAGNTAYECATILEVDAGGNYVVVGGDAAAGRVYPYIVGAVAAAANYNGAAWVEFTCGVIVQPAAADQVIAFSVSGSAQSDYLLSGSSFAPSVACAWIRFDSVNVNAVAGNYGISVLLDNGARVAMDLCQLATAVSGAGVFSYGLVIRGKSSLMSGCFFNGSVINGNQGFDVQYGVPAEVQAWTLGGANPTIYANPALGCRFSNRKGIGWSTTTAVTSSIYVYENSSVLLEGCYSPATRLSTIQNGSTWSSLFGSRVGNVNVNECSGDMFGRLKAAYIDVDMASDIYVAGSLHLVPSTANRALTLGRGSRLEIAVNLTVTQVNNAGGIQIAKRSDLFVDGTTTIAHTGAGANANMLIENNSSFVTDNTVTITSDSTGYAIYLNEGSHYQNDGGDTVITKTGVTNGIILVGDQSTADFSTITATASGSTVAGDAQIYVLSGSKLYAAGAITIQMPDTALGPVIYFTDSSSGVFDGAILFTPTGLPVVWSNGESKFLVNDGSSVVLNSTLAGNHGNVAVDYGANGFVYITQSSKMDIGAYTYQGPIAVATDSDLLADSLTIGTAAGPAEVLVDRTCLDIRSGSRVVVAGNLATRNVVAAAQPTVSVAQGSALNVGGTTGLVHTTAGNGNDLYVLDSSNVLLVGGVTITTDHAGAASTSVYIGMNSNVHMSGGLTITATGVGACAEVSINNRSTLQIDGNTTVAGCVKTGPVLYEMGSCIVNITGAINVTHTGGGASHVLYIDENSMFACLDSFASASSCTEAIIRVEEGSRANFNSTIGITDNAAGTNVVQLVNQASMFVGDTFTLVTSAKTGNTFDVEGGSNLEVLGVTSLTETGAGGRSLYVDTISTAVFASTFLHAVASAKTGTFIQVDHQSTVKMTGAVTSNDASAGAGSSALLCGNGSSLFLGGAFTVTGTTKTGDVVYAYNNAKIEIVGAVIVTNTGGGGTAVLNAMDESSIILDNALTATTNQQSLAGTGLIYSHDDSTIVITGAVGITDSGASNGHVVSLYNRGTLYVYSTFTITDTKKTGHLIYVEFQSKGHFGGTLTVNDSAAGAGASVVYVYSMSEMVISAGGLDVNATTKTGHLIWTSRLTKISMSSIIIDTVSAGASSAIYVTDQAQFFVPTTTTIGSTAMTGNTIYVTDCSTAEFTGAVSITETGADANSVVLAERESKIEFYGTFTIAGTVKTGNLICAANMSEIYLNGAVAITDTAAGCTTAHLRVDDESKMYFGNTVTASTTARTGATAGLISLSDSSYMRLVGNAVFTDTNATVTQKILVDRGSTLVSDAQIHITNTATSAADGTFMIVRNGSTALVDQLTWNNGAAVAAGNCWLVLVTLGSKLQVADVNTAVITSDNTSAGVTNGGLRVTYGSTAMVPAWGASAGIGCTGAAGTNDYRIGAAGGGAEWTTPQANDATQMCYIVAGAP